MKKKDDEENVMEELHQQRVTSDGQECCGKCWTRARKPRVPTAWTGGAQILKKEEEDARLLNSCEANMKEWAKQWQCDETVQNIWRPSHGTNEDLKKFEEALPRYSKRVRSWKKLRDCMRQKTGVGCDGVHVQNPLDLTTETRREIVELLEKCGTKWTMAAARLHNEVLFDSERCHK